MRHVRIAFPETEEGTSVICPSRWRESFGGTRASADVWGIYKVSHTVVPVGRSGLNYDSSTHTYTRASHPLDIWSHFPLSAREPAPSDPAGILSHYRTHVSSIPSTASSCDAAWRHESSRLLGKQRRAVDEFMGNGGAGGGIERIGGKGKSRTALFRARRVSW